MYVVKQPSEHELCDYILYTCVHVFYFYMCLTGAILATTFQIRLMSTFSNKLETNFTLSSYIIIVCKYVIFVYNIVPTHDYYTAYLLVCVCVYWKNKRRWCAFLYYFNTPSRPPLFRSQKGYDCGSYALHKQSLWNFR